MNRKHPLAVSLFLLVAGVALAQEVVVNVPARAMRARVTGERIAYVLSPDGGVVGCTTQAESSISVPPEPLVTTECNQSRQRARSQVADAIDGGTFSQ